MKKNKIEQTIGRGFYVLIYMALCLTAILTFVVFIASLFETDKDVRWWLTPIFTLLPVIMLLPSLVCKITTYYVGKNKGDRTKYDDFFSIFLIMNIAIVVGAALIYSWASDYRKDYPEYYNEVDYRIDNPY